MSLWIEAYYCQNQDQCKSEEEIGIWKQNQKIFSFYSNSKKYQPNLYGDEIVLKYTDFFVYNEVADKLLIYELQQHTADSEESFLGLGLIPNNQ